MQPDKQPTIVFDFGGVLMDWDPRYLFRKLFNGDEAEMEYFLQVVCSQEWNRKQDAGYPFAKAIEERIERYPAYKPYIQAYQDRWTEMISGPIHGTVEILMSLRDANYHLCALSNWSSDTFQLVYERFDFFNWFDEVIISGTEKVIKPDPAIYKLLLRRINREAHQCLFIDDVEANILAASHLGFQTIHFTTPEHLHQALIERKLL
jgi:2-haloacid dehalogenase